MNSAIYLCLLAYLRISASAPSNGIRFPDERQDKKIEPVITPPVLPVIEHLERDPSTLYPGEPKQLAPSNRVGPGIRQAPSDRRAPGRPKFGGFSVGPNGNGGFSGSVSSSGGNGGPGLSHSASQSFSFGFNNGFSASQSASQSASFSGFGGSSSFAGSQASSQAASFGGSGVSSSASQAASIAGGGFGGHGGPGFGGNSGSPYETPYDEVNFGEGVLDIRHRGAPNFQFPSFAGRGRGVGAAAYRTSSRKSTRKSSDDWVAILVSD